MIELSPFVVAILGIFAIIGFIDVVGRFSSPRRTRIRVDGTVNSKRHLLACGLISQAHRQGDPEF
ncbi:hypothetical protein LCGC14_1178620 [marine sediment metagenome]|uniref:Uncharacterized protein n=1 Tax=marine sediment metagenome TaxID=412755 RepID=A0A0F9PTC0_9ZZZZ